MATKTGIIMIDNFIENIPPEYKNISDDIREKLISRFRDRFHSEPFPSALRVTPGMVPWSGKNPVTKKRGYESGLCG
jgi:hypothetical protein